MTIWSMTVGICLMLALVHLTVWVRARDSWPSLYFSLSAACASATAIIELALMHAQTPVESGCLLGWLHVSVSLIVVALVWFVRAYLRAGSLWLAWLNCGLRALTVVVNFLPGRANILFLEMDVPRQTSLWGETVWVPTGVRSEWATFVGATSVLFLIYVLGAIIAAWRRGDRRRASVLGGAISLAMLLGMIQTRLLATGDLPTPLAVTVIFLLIVCVMGLELSGQLVRAGQVARDLLASERRMRLATTAASLNVWEWDIARERAPALASGNAPLHIDDTGRIDFDRFLQTLHPDDLEPLRRAIQRSLTGNGELEAEYRVIRPDGATRWISTRGQVERAADGRPLRLRGVSMDITERRQAEAEVSRQQALLTHVSRLSTLGQLATALAHELNQPLGAILSNAEAAEILLEEHPLPLDQLRDILADIRHDDERASEVIRRMRALLRRREMGMTLLDINDVVRDVLRIVKADASLRTTGIRTELTPGPLPVIGDRVHLQQVLLNLIVNGMEAVAGLSSERRLLIVRTTRNDDSGIEVAVSDNGRGIPTGDLPRVFQPFYTTKPDGMGIGISIAQTIIKMHNGRIWAENNPSGGATFRFTLKPVEDPPTEAHRQ